MHKFLTTVALAAMATTGFANAQTGSSSSSGSATQTGTQTQDQVPFTSAKLADKPPVTYDNRYEVYGGIGLQTFQAGQNIPKKMIFGNVEAMGTYWLTRKLGVAADFRGGAGTTDVFPNSDHSRPTVVQYTGMGGVEYRGPKNQFAAISYHALAGASYGIFDETARQDLFIGLYTNRTSPTGVIGGSVDFNRTKNLALRLSPDLVFEHYGTELREFFALSGGIVYRFGKR